MASTGGHGRRRRRSEEEEEERLYLHLETRERVQTNEAKSKRRRASPTQTTIQRDGRVTCPTWSADLSLLQGLSSETRWLPGQCPVGGARPELVRYHLFFGPWDVRLAWVHVAGVLAILMFIGTLCCNRLNSAAYLHIAN